MNRVPLLFVILLGTLLAACSQHEPLAELPGLIEVYPANGATDVPVDVQVRATFDAPLAGAELLDGLQVVLGDQNVAGTLSVDDSVLVFTPAAALEAGALYSVTLADSMPVLAAAGLDESDSWSFTTVAASSDDEGEPTGGDEEPTDGDDGEPTDGGGGSTDTDDDGLSDDVDPDPENPDTDADGVLDGEDSDLGLDGVASISPLPREEVGKDAVISLTFDNELDCSTVEDGALEVYYLVDGNHKVNNGAEPVAISGTLACDGDTLTFTPTDDLNTPSGWFWLFIQIDALDVDGNAIQIDAHWRFRAR